MEYFKNERNIAKILGYTENPYTIIMKYYKMGSLNHWIKKKKHRLKSFVCAFAHDISTGVSDYTRKVLFIAI